MRKENGLISFLLPGDKTMNFCNCLSGRQAGRGSIGFFRRCVPSQKKRIFSLRPRPLLFLAPGGGNGFIVPAERQGGAKRRIGDLGRRFSGAGNGKCAPFRLSEAPDGRFFDSAKTVIFDLPFPETAQEVFRGIGFRTVDR